MDRRQLLGSALASMAGLGLVTTVAGCSSGDAGHEGHDGHAGHGEHGADGAASASSSQHGPYQYGTKISNGWKLPSVPLTDMHGKPYTLDTSSTAPATILFFGYTNCPDICPQTLADLATARAKLPAEVAKKLQVLFVSTDPDRDTPQALKDYLSRIDEHFLGLTGNADAVKKAGDSLGADWHSIEKSASGKYEVQHTTTVFGFGKDHLLDVLWNQGTTPDQFAADWQTLVRTKG